MLPLNDFPEDQSDLPSGYPPIPSLMLTFPTPILPNSPVFSPPPCGNAALSVHSIPVGHSEPTFLCDSCELTLDLCGCQSIVDELGVLQIPISSRFSHEEVNTWQRWTTLARKKLSQLAFGSHCLASSLLVPEGDLIQKISSHLMASEGMAWISKTSKEYDILAWHHRTSHSSF